MQPQSSNHTHPELEDRLDHITSRLDGIDRRLDQFEQRNEMEHGLILDQLNGLTRTTAAILAALAQPGTN
jgi:transposase